MKKNAGDGSLGIVQGDTGYEFVSDKSLAGVLGLFQKRIAEEANALIPPVPDSGRILSDENFKQKITESGSVTAVDLFMVYYADYVNKGVKGKDDDSNAPNSPYQFKNYGMPEEGRKSILASISRGKMKVSDVSKTRYGKIGTETKAKETANEKDINEREADTAIYMIKKYGIKERRFIDKAWVKFREDLIDNLTEWAGKKIVFNIRKSFDK